MQTQLQKAERELKIVKSAPFLHTIPI